MAIQIKKPYKIERRLTNKITGRRLSGFAIDLTLRFNSGGFAFLQDMNAEGKRKVLPMNDVEYVVDFIADEIRRNYNEHFHR